MTTRQRLTRDERREQLLDSAESLFALQGYESTTMDDIARAAGVTRAVVYAHYPSRDDILLEGIRRAHEELDRRLTDLAAGISSHESVADIVGRGGDLFFEMLEDLPSRWGLLFAPLVSSPTSSAGELPALRRTTIMRIADVGLRLQSDVSRQQIEALAYMVSGLGEQLGRWWLTQTDVPRAQVVAYYRDFIMGGIRDLLGERAEQIH